MSFSIKVFNLCPGVQTDVQQISDNLFESEMKRRIVRSAQTNKGELKMDNIKQVIALVLIVLLSMLGTAPL